MALDTGGFSVSELRNKRRLSKMNCEVTEPEDVKKKVNKKGIAIRTPSKEISH